jgi:hypothetical protein
MNDLYLDIQKVFDENEQQAAQLLQIKNTLAELITACDCSNHWSKKDIAHKLQEITNSIK